jgi:hypothetical protein
MPRKLSVPFGGVTLIIGVGLTLALEGGLIVLGVVIALTGGMLLALALEGRLDEDEVASTSGMAKASHRDQVPDRNPRPQLGTGSEPTAPPLPPAA